LRDGTLGDGICDGCGRGPEWVVVVEGREGEPIGTGGYGVEVVGLLPTDNDDGACGDAGVHVGIGAGVVLLICGHGYRHGHDGGHERGWLVR
jgi:hypothetical protein